LEIFKKLGNILVFYDHKESQKEFQDNFDAQGFSPERTRTDINREYILCEFKEYTCYWQLYDKSSSTGVEKVTTSLIRGKHYSLVGGEKSGRTSFLHAIAQTVPYTEGKLEVNNLLKFAFVEERSYVFPLSFRENVIFGKEFNEELYDKVLSCCCLQPDVEKLPYKDFTILSKIETPFLTEDMKSRIALARALYSQSDVFLIDNVFMHIDKILHQKIWRRVFRGMLRSRTVLICLNEREYIKETDSLLFFDKGKLLIEGNYSSLDRKNIGLINGVINHNDMLIEDVLDISEKLDLIYENTNTSTYTKQEANNDGGLLSNNDYLDLRT
jgi:ABC-type transport system involved in cytochrome bd biosynthesis fused ATPase/permease subunit